MSARAVGVAVCGFGRCGTTMTMAMLEAGGVPPVAGSTERGYELPGGSDAWVDLPPEAFDGRAVKLLDAIVWHLMPKASVDWRIIWCDRDPREQGKSMRKLLALQGIDADARELAAGYRRDRFDALDNLSYYGPVLTLDYERTLRAPAKAADAIRQHLRPDIPMDTAPAAAAVHRRRPYCAPDLTFETTGEIPR